MSSARRLSIPICIAALTAAGVILWLMRQPPPPPDLPVPPAAEGAAKSWHLSSLALPPDWSRLDPWQERMSRAEFERLLITIVSDGESWKNVVQLEADAALISATTAEPAQPPYRLRFAPPGTRPAKNSDRYWRTAAEIGPPADTARPLAGVRIAIDPGHIGGYWSKMEERHFAPDDGPPVCEGDITLRTAILLKPELEALGATVSLVRSGPQPVTPLRPADLRNAAGGVRREAEHLFYLVAEISARASLVNDQLRPDLVLCLHFNAEGSWSVAGRTVFSTANHLHLIVHGCVTPEEFAFDDQRLEILHRLVQGTHDAEIAVSRSVAAAMTLSTGLPAYHYPGRGTARQVDPAAPLLWARNLRANRLYRCPVVFCEPWVMNNEETTARLRAGDFEGETEIAGKKRRSIFHEYVEGVSRGLHDYFLAARTGAAAAPR